MTSDADRFRPRKPDERDRGGISQQTPPTAPSAYGERRRESPSGPARAQSPDRAQPAPQPRPTPRYAPPSAPASGQRYAPPSGPAAGQRYAPPIADREAQLIHPAAAQLSRYTPYGVPVYQAPVYAPPPAPHRGLSITAMVLGLCSVVFAWTLVVVPILGLVFGFIALRREPAGKAMAVTGLITSALGMLAILLFYVLPLFGLLGAAFLGFAAP